MIHSITDGMKKVKPFYLLGALLALSVGASSLYAQPVINYEEAKVGTYQLPPLLQTEKGTRVSTVKQWEQLQRPVLLQKFSDHVYGRIPGKPKGMHFQVTATDTQALNGKATRKEVTVFFTQAPGGPAMHLLLYLPNRVSGKVPVFVGLNFKGNHSVQKDDAIMVTDSWKRLHPTDTLFERGEQEGRWPVEELINSGYGLATAWYQDLEGDTENGWQTGVRTTLQKELAIEPKEWAAIGVWAWGLSRILDYLQTDPRVDARKVVLTGHSRLGKAALWAGANDQRFAIVVSNDSGEGGAALARRNYGETIYRINTSFPHWFVDRYKQYNTAVDQLPVDQHMLLALIAPRPLYVASALDDQWADPKGEFLGALYAGEVYRLYGRKGIDATEPPPVNNPVGEVVRYHIRPGKHDITTYDWQQYIAFANKHFRYSYRP